jgi:hypothetical protein
MSLDETTIKNKAIQTPPAKKEFHFAGGGVWRNATILAETIEEAEKLWHATKQLISEASAGVSQGTSANASEQSTALADTAPESEVQ